MPAPVSEATIIARLCAGFDNVKTTLTTGKQGEFYMFVFFAFENERVASLLERVRMEKIVIVYSQGGFVTFFYTSVFDGKILPMEQKFTVLRDENISSRKGMRGCLCLV